jgi:hypothetical protein
MRINKNYNGLWFDRNPKGISFIEGDDEVVITWEQIYLTFGLVVQKLKKGEESQLLGEILSILQDYEDEEE